MDIELESIPPYCNYHSSTAVECMEIVLTFSSLHRLEFPLVRIERVPKGDWPAFYPILIFTSQCCHFAVILQCCQFAEEEMRENQSTVVSWHLEKGVIPKLGHGVKQEFLSNNYNRRTD